MRSLGALSLLATTQRCNVITEIPTALAACCVLQGFAIYMIYITYLIQLVKRLFRPLKPSKSPFRICRICGATIRRGQTYCASCAVGVSRGGLIEAAKLGRIATHCLEAETLRAKTQRKHTAALAAWQPSVLPEWFNEEVSRTKIQPALAGITVPAIATALGISQSYDTDIRAGKRRPHPRHWLKLARMVGVLGADL